MRTFIEIPLRRPQPPARRWGVASAAPRVQPGGCACGGGCPRCDPGQPLGTALRSTMESRLGARLGDVRVHDDTPAHRLAQAAGARALTAGAHVFFARGRGPTTGAEGRERLAHELVHVLQQRRGATGGSPAGEPEQEARRLGTAVAAGRAVQVQGAAPPGGMQHDDDPAAPSGSLGPMFSPGAAPQLQLDPQIEALLLRNYLRWWLGTTLSSEAPTTLPSPEDVVPQSGAAQAEGGPALPLPTLPLPADLFTPLPPDRLFIEPDVGALFSPFGLRGATVGPGDVDAVLGIYRRNERLVRGLPDLHAIAPGFVRPLIPSTWRRDIAGALTGAAVDAALKRDFASPIEVSDRAFEAMTGSGTTIIPLPSISFDLLGGGK